MKKLENFQCGMGIGGWLTNYKRFNVLPKDRRMVITIGDLEHFRSYISEKDIEYIASLGMDHIRLGFDQIVLEEAPYKYREEIFEILHNFVDWCKKYRLGTVLNMHKALGNYCDILEERGLMQDEELQNRFIAVWEKLEDEFSSDNEIMFELLNEVVNATPNEWNALAEKTLDALRKKNKSRKIIIGCTEWNKPPGLKNQKIWDYENVIYTFHCY
ncbi:MAG: cellulase family glycosylhydrolase, partial [Clostridia bacterium]|nr:cellulase family glycosylhydrolase [Clostridia bacterium]